MKSFGLSGLLSGVGIKLMFPVVSIIAQSISASEKYPLALALAIKSSMSSFAFFKCKALQIFAYGKEEYYHTAFAVFSDSECPD